jgi:2,3-bisphosphoglycerate-dependent phosphoglycerate mutase
MKRLQINTHRFVQFRKNIWTGTQNKKIVLIRHGESVWNQESKFTGWTNIPLSKNGKKEAENIAFTLIENNLFPNIIFSSVLDRFIETSNIIRNNLVNIVDIPIHTSWRLNEKHYGTLEGIPRKYIKNLYGEKFTQLMRKSFYMKPPILREYQNVTNYPIYKNCYFKKIMNGESKENVLERLLPYFENDIMFTLSENKFPLIVTHKHSARVLMKHLLQMNEEEFEKYEFPNKKIVVLEFNNENNYVGSNIIPY